ncbi:MAG TPA: alpha-amylase family glycosyl hydrolase [Anaeromyxobacter sp.]|nr:alpha-amylase family glycosyl hydrolase [Anaeromyxobacter sp.]
MCSRCPLALALSVAVLALPLAPPLAAPSPGAERASSRPDEWWKGAVFYQVFVRSFADSDGDGVGDLAGLTDHLDYLNDGDPATHDDLGVDAILLMPVFASPSYHGYDVTDYERIASAYGDLDSFSKLVQAAHRRGLKVILDLPLNHTSDEHPWFKDSASGRASRRRGWYEWSPKDPGWGKPWDLSSKAWHRRGKDFYYGLFEAGMPDLNYQNQEVREEMKRIIRLWLGRGADGFRLDAVRFLVETGPVRGQVSTPLTHAYLKELSQAVRAEKPGAVLVGEVWSVTEDIADYYGNGSDELDLAFDFPLAAAIVSAAANGRTDELSSVLAAARRAYPPGAVDAPFLTNHDQIRIATRVQNDPARLRLAAALLFTLPGSPFVYQGEELGEENGDGQADEEKRTPLPFRCEGAGHGFTNGTPWHAFAKGAEQRCVERERADPTSLLSFYRDLIVLRHASPALLRGDLEPVGLPGAPHSALAFLRKSEAEVVLCIHNAGPEPLDTGPLELPATSAEPLLPGSPPLEAVAGGLRAVLPPLSSGAWRLF